MLLRILDRLVAWYADARMGNNARRAFTEQGVKLTRAEITPEGWSVQASAPDLVHLLDQATKLLDESGAENYLQFWMLPRFDRHRRAVLITIQRAQGESPADQNARLRAELAELRRRVEVIRDENLEIQAHYEAAGSVPAVIDYTLRACKAALEREPGALPLLTIASETRLWQLYEKEQVTEGFLSELLGLDRLELRGRYMDFCDTHGSATEARKREALAKIDKRLQERQLDATE